MTCLFVSSVFGSSQIVDDRMKVDIWNMQAKSFMKDVLVPPHLNVCYVLFLNCIALYFASSFFD